MTAYWGCGGITPFIRPRH